MSNYTYISTWQRRQRNISCPLVDRALHSDEFWEIYENGEAGSPVANLVAIAPDRPTALKIVESLRRADMVKSASGCLVTEQGKELLRNSAAWQEWEKNNEPFKLEFA